VSETRFTGGQVLTLGEKQRVFTRNVAKLITWAYEQGFEITFGEAWRTPEQAALNAKKGSGISTSLHISRLAIDLNLFRDGRFLVKSEDHRPLGTYWKSLNPLNCWGGDFKDSRGLPAPDGNHYSMSHAGAK
jgi:hypothetical protein